MRLSVAIITTGTGMNPPRPPPTAPQNRTPPRSTAPRIPKLAPRPTGSPNLALRAIGRTVNHRRRRHMSETGLPRHSAVNRHTPGIGNKE